MERFMEESELRKQAFQFAKHVVLTCRWMRKNGVEYSLVDQFLRCGTSVGANIHEAQHAHGLKDFSSKLEIALKESNECKYWIKLLFSTDSIRKPTYDALMDECSSVQRMLVASLNTIKNK